MKVLVTGGAGFIGSHVVDRLLEEDHQVAVVDDLSTGKERNLNPDATFYKLDICDFIALEEVFRLERPQIVNHHAAHVDVRRSVKEPSFDARVNILGSLNLLELSRRHGVEKFIYISTGGAVYGEPRYLPVDESHPIQPISPYGVSKHAGELYLIAYREAFGMRSTILRYPNVYGPRQDPHGEAGVVAIFSELMLVGERPTIFGDGGKTRDYVYVDDIVRANLLVMDRSGDGEIYNLGWGKEVTDFEIFRAVRDAVGAKVEPIYGEKRPGEVERICLDSTKARQELGWEPTVPLEEGIPRAVEYYRRNT